MASITANSAVCAFLVFTLSFLVICDDCPATCRCTSIKTGGQKVICTLNDIKSLRIDKLPRGTVELNLAYNQIKIIRKDSFPVSRKVKRLDLRGNHIQHIEPGAFKKFPRLTKLYLQVNKLTNIEKDTFKGLKNLRHLNISQNNLLYIHKDAFASIKNLKRISLKKNKLTTLRQNTFSNTSKIELDDNELICDCDISWLVKITQQTRRGASDGTKCKFPKALAGKKIRYLAAKQWHCKNAVFELPMFKTQPVENQIAFQNDSLELTCSSIWQPRGRLSWEAHPNSLKDVLVKDHSDLYARENKSILTIKRVDLHHSGLYVCKALINNVNEVTKSVAVSVIGWQTKFCPLQHKSTKKGNFAWHSTAPGGYAQLACPYGKQLKAWRNCSVDGKWDVPDLSACQHENILTRKLATLRKRDINTTSIRHIIADILNITRVYQKKFTESIQLQLLESLFFSICSAKFPISSDSAKVIKGSVSSILSNILSINASLFEINGSSGKTTPGLLKALEDFLTEYLNREIHYSSKDIPVALPVSSGVAAYSRSYRPKYPHALVCSVLFKKDGDPSSSGFGDCGISINGTNVLKGFDAQIILPKVFFALSSSSIFDDSRQLTNVSFISYKTTELFPDSNLLNIKSTSRQASVNSAVLGIHVQVPGIGSTGLISNENIVFKFKKIQAGSTPRLVFWSSYSKQKGSEAAWRESKKCKLMSETASCVKFVCSELPGEMTYFAIVMDIPHEKDSAALFQLEIVTYFGAGLCSVFLLMTLATYAFFRELRYNRNDAATLMNLCLALFVAVIIFVVGITRIDNKLLCKSFAVLLHYFLLCGLLWLGCGGACLTSLIKKGPENEEYNPVLKYYLVSWGLPMIVCGITLAGNSKNYNTDNYCWLTSRASIGAFIVPGGLIVIANMIVFLRLHALINRRFPESAQSYRAEHAAKRGISHDEGKPTFHFPDRSQLLDFIKGSLTVMLILCIDCGFVVMIFINKNSSSKYLYYIFSYGFAIANVLLGLAVFVFHCVRREDVYHCWKSYLLKKSKKLNVQEVNETDALIDQTDNTLHTSNMMRSSVTHSEHNHDHSDIISALSASLFTHDIQSSRPSSIFGHSCPPAHDKSHGQGRLTLPTFENKTAVNQGDSPRVEPSASPLPPPENNPLAGFAAYPPSTVPETVSLSNDRSYAVASSEQPYTAALNEPPSMIGFEALQQFPKTALSEKTFSERSNSVKTNARPVTTGHELSQELPATVPSERTFSEHSNIIESKQRPTDGTRENIMSDCSSIPSHIDAVNNRPANAPLPLRSFVAPNWKPVRSGGSTAVFYPYVDPGFKLMQAPPVQNSTDSVAVNGPVQGPAVIRPEPVNPMVPAGAFTIPQRTEAISGANSNKTHSAGHQTDQDQAAKKLTEVTEPKEKVTQVTQVKKSRSTRRRRTRNRPRFDDIPVEKCIVYVPLPHVSPKKPEIGNETSV